MWRDRHSACGQENGKKAENRLCAPAIDYSWGCISEGVLEWRCRYNYRMMRLMIVSCPCLPCLIPLSYIISFNQPHKQKLNLMILSESNSWITIYGRTDQCYFLHCRKVGRVRSVEVEALVIPGSPTSTRSSDFRI